MVKDGLPIEKNPNNIVSTLMITVVDTLAAAAMISGGLEAWIAALSRRNVNERTLYIANIVAVELAEHTKNMIDDDLKLMLSNSGWTKCSAKLKQVSKCVILKEVALFLAENDAMETLPISPVAYAKSAFLRLVYAAQFGTEPDLKGNTKVDEDAEASFLNGKNLNDAKVGFAGSLKGVSNNWLYVILFALPSVVRNAYIENKQLFELDKLLYYDESTGHPFPTDEDYRREFLKNKPTKKMVGGVEKEATLTCSGAIKFNGPVGLTSGGLLNGLRPASLCLPAIVEGLKSGNLVTGFRTQPSYLFDVFTLDGKPRPKPVKHSTPTKSTPKQVVTRISKTLVDTCDYVLEMSSGIQSELEKEGGIDADGIKKILSGIQEKMNETKKEGESNLKPENGSSAKKRRAEADEADKDKDQTTPAQNNDESTKNQAQKKRKR